MTIDMLPEVALGVAGGDPRAALDRSSSRTASAQTVAALLRQSFLSLDFVRTYHDSLAAELDHKGCDPDILLDACRLALEALDGIAESRRLLAKLLADDEHEGGIPAAGRIGGRVAADVYGVAGGPEPASSRRLT